MFCLVPAEVKVWYELSLHSVIKHVIVIFFDQFKIYSSVRACVRACVRVKRDDCADIDEGCLSSEMYGTVCNRSSYSMIIKTTVLCDDRNRS